VKESERARGREDVESAVESIGPAKAEDERISDDGQIVVIRRQVVEKEIHERWSNVDVIMITGYGSIASSARHAVIDQATLPRTIRLHGLRQSDLRGRGPATRVHASCRPGLRHVRRRYPVRAASFLAARQAGAHGGGAWGAAVDAWRATSGVTDVL
jgi:hypothetical protein